MEEFLKILGINGSISEALKKENITKPAKVQEEVIPEALNNRDLIVQAETGSGKTFAYLIPLFKKIDFTKREMQGIILAPTHELVIQVQRQVEFLSTCAETKINSAVILGNVNIKRQIEKLREKPQLIIGSPGRILELIKQKKITAHTIKTIVIDEADSLFDLNNFQLIKDIIKTTQRDRQLLAFSASITKDTENKAREIMEDPLFIKVGDNNTVPESIQHLYFQVELRDKIETLRKIIRIVNPEKAIVFIGEREEAEKVAGKLSYHKLIAEGIHGQYDKMDRKRIMENFKNGKTQILVASDLAARGLDIKGITHIFNLNIPRISKSYLHRAGRTGRQGEQGTCISIVTEKEKDYIKLYEKELKIKVLPKKMYKGRIQD